jgi:hypothetical protein
LVAHIEGGPQAEGVCEKCAQIDEVTEEWRKLPIEELNDLYSSPSIFPVIELRRMRWVGHVARMRKRRVVYRVLVGNMRERDHFEDPSIDERVIYYISSGSVMWGFELN